MIGKTPRKKEVEVEVESERRRIGAVRRAIGRIFNRDFELRRRFEHLQLVPTRLLIIALITGRTALIARRGRRIRHLVRRRNRRLLLL